MRETKVIPVLLDMTKPKIMADDLAEILLEKEQAGYEPMCMDILRWNYDHEDMTDESYEWRKTLNYDMLKMVCEWDRKWCESLQKLFEMIR